MSTTDRNALSLLSFSFGHCMCTPLLPLPLSTQPFPVFHDSCFIFSPPAYPITLTLICGIFDSISSELVPVFGLSFGTFPICIVDCGPRVDRRISVVE